MTTATTTFGGNTTQKQNDCDDSDDIDFVQWKLIPERTIQSVRGRIAKIKRLPALCTSAGEADMILIVTCDLRWYLMRWMKSGWIIVDSRSLLIEDYCRENDTQWSRYNADPVKRNMRDVGISLVHHSERQQLEILIAPFHNLLYFLEIHPTLNGEAVRVAQYRPVVIHLEDCIHLLQAELFQSIDQQKRHHIALLYRCYGEDELEEPPSTHLCICVADLSRDSEEDTRNTILFNRKPLIRRTTMGPWSIGDIEPPSFGLPPVMHVFEEKSIRGVLLLHSANSIQLITEDGVVCARDNGDTSVSTTSRDVSSIIKCRLIHKCVIPINPKKFRRTITSYIAVDEEGKCHHIVLDIIERTRSLSSRTEFHTATIVVRPVPVPNGMQITDPHGIVCQNIATAERNLECFVCSIFGRKDVAVVEIGYGFPRSLSSQPSEDRTNYYTRIYYRDESTVLFRSMGRITDAFIHNFRNREQHIVCVSSSSRAMEPNDKNNASGYINVCQLGFAINQYTPIIDDAAMEGRPDVYSVRYPTEDRSLIFFSYSHGTKLFRTDTMTEAETEQNHGFETGRRTLAASFVENTDCIIQVTDQDVRIINTTSERLVFRNDSLGKKATDKIEIAQIRRCDGLVVLAVRSSLAVLLMDRKTRRFNVERVISLPSQASALHLNQKVQGRPVLQYLAVSTWVDNQILVFSIPSFQLQQVIHCDTIIRSLVLHRFEHAEDDILFAGMGDGRVIWWSMEGVEEHDEHRTPAMLQAGSVIIGESPVILSAIIDSANDNAEYVYANSNSDAVLYFEKQTGQVSVGRVCKDFRVHSVTETSSPDFGRCLIYLREKRSDSIIQFGALDTDLNLRWQERTLTGGHPIACCVHGDAEVYCVATAKSIHFFSADTHLRHIFTYDQPENTESLCVVSMKLTSTDKPDNFCVMVAMSTVKSAIVGGNKNHYQGTRILEVFHITRHENDTSLNYNIAIIHRQSLGSGLLFDNPNVRSLHILDRHPGWLLSELNGDIYFIQIKIHDYDRRQLSMKVKIHVNRLFLREFCSSSGVYESSTMLSGGTHTNHDEPFAKSTHAKILSPLQDYLSCLDCFSIGVDIFICCGYLLSGNFRIYRIDMQDMSIIKYLDTLFQPPNAVMTMDHLPPIKCSFLVDESKLLLVDYTQQLIFLEMNLAQRSFASTDNPIIERSVAQDIETIRRQLVDIFSNEDDKQLQLYGQNTIGEGHDRMSIIGAYNAENPESPRNTGQAIDVHVSQRAFTSYTIHELKYPVQHIIKGCLGLQSSVDYTSSSSRSNCNPPLLLVNINGSISTVIWEPSQLSWDQLDRRKNR